MNMKRIVIIFIGLISVAYGQSSPTSAKTRFVNGLYVGTKLDSYFAAADSNAIYWRADSALMAKYKGTARRVLFVNDTTAMLLPYLRKSDTAAMLADYVDLGSTQTIAGLKTFTGIVNSGGGLFATGGSMWASGAVESFVGSIGFGNSNAARVAIYDDNGGMAGGKNVSFIPAYSSPSTPRAATNSSQAGYYFSKGGSVNFYANSSVSGDAIAIPKLRVDSTGDVRVFSTTASSSTTTGALIVSGGVGAAGNINAASFIRSGGTSSQFLKADGSVDGTSYATAASISGTTNFIPKFTSSSAIGNSVIFDNSGKIGIGTTTASNLLTVRHGAADGVRVEFSGNNDYLFIDASTVQAYNSGAASVLKLNPVSTGRVLIGTATDNTVDRLQVNGSISGTSLSMSGIGLFNGAVDDGTNKLIVNGGVKGTSDLTLETTSPNVYLKRANTSSNAAIRFNTGETLDFYVGTGVSGTNSDFHVYSGTLGADALTILKATGAATFSSSVTAGSFIRSGGTSSQSLMADGSVQTLTSGTYTPTLTNTQNISSSTASVSSYTRIGNIVTVYAVASATTSAAGQAELTFSVPIATSAANAVVVGSGIDSIRFPINNGSSGTTVGVRWTATSGTATNINVIFQYTVN